MINSRYILKNSLRAKCLRISIYPDKKVVVTAPSGMNTRAIENFVTKNKDWIKNKLDFFDKKGNVGFTSGSKKDYKNFKETALKLAVERLNFYNKTYNYLFNKVTIRNQKTRWGSCSKKGNLNFNYKIVLIPLELADYIIVHELCHLKELNHSNKFWDLVAKSVPNYKELRKRIRNIT